MAPSLSLPLASPLDPAVCYRALQARDARFDGRFFVAVRSTGVYCRPVCPARTPRRENCFFVSCAAAAQEAGFRPCMRCRPEASPGTPAWQGTSATVSRALRLIGEGALDEGSVGRLAERLGIGDRHLRRLFLEHLGASPRAVAETRRLLFAKRLLDETRLPVSEVAHAAGFKSLRRFNAVVRRTWDRTPRELRGRRGLGRSEGEGRPELELRLPFRAPLDWEALLGFLALRAIPGVEAVDSECYTRTVQLGETVGVVRVEPVPDAHHLRARVRLARAGSLIHVSERLRSVFDLGADPEAIAEQLAADPLLAPRVQARPGLRVPGAWDGFELMVRAILGQQVSGRGATTLAGRLVERFGTPLPAELEIEPGSPDRLFPEPQALVSIEPGDVGLTRARAAASRGLARAVVAGEVELESGSGLEASVRRLRALPGIGEWTAQYIAMRAYREPDAFPSGDLGLRKALGGAKGPLPERELELRSAAWRPWRAYAALHLWTPSPSGPGRRTERRRKTR